jgi:hypothetical protein
LLSPPSAGYYQPRSWSADGRVLVTHVPGTGGGEFRHGWVSLEEKEWHDLPLPEGVDGFGCDTGMAWAPESARLAVAGLGYAHPCNLSPGLAVLDLERGAAQRIVAPAVSAGTGGDETLTAGAHTPAWSPDGRWIAFGLDGDAREALVFPTRLYRAHPDGSDLTPLTDNAQGSAAYPAWAPDGTLYYSLDGASAEADGIYRYDAGANRHTRLVPGSGLHPLSVSPDGEFLLYEQEGKLSIWSLRLDELHAEIPGEEGAQPVFTGWTLIQGR